MRDWGCYSRMVAFSLHALETSRPKEDYVLRLMDTLGSCTFCPSVSVLLWAVYLTSLSFRLSIRSKVGWMNLKCDGAQRWECGVHLQRDGSYDSGTRSIHSIGLKNGCLEPTLRVFAFPESHFSKNALFELQIFELSTAVWNMLTKRIWHKLCFCLSSFNRFSWLVFFLTYFIHVLCIHLVVSSLRYEGRHSSWCPTWI